MWLERYERVGSIGGVVGARDEVGEYVEATRRIVESRRLESVHVVGKGVVVVLLPVVLRRRRDDSVGGASARALERLELEREPVDQHDEGDQAEREPVAGTRHREIQALHAVAGQKVGVERALDKYVASFLVVVVVIFVVLQLSPVSAD